ncbi:MAG: hypothetical protein IJ087_07895 [Eggerthellaceae bacterium]|nr:hypothetical protein [Eggerthellaceae bacterium]
MLDVVANSTPIIVLAKIGRLDLLMRLYGEVAIPRAVYDLRGVGFYVSDAVVDMALAAAGE